MCRGDEESPVQGSNGERSPQQGFALPTAAVPAAATIHPGFQIGNLGSPKVDNQAQQVLLPTPVIMYCVQQDGGMLCWPADPHQQRPPLQLLPPAAPAPASPDRPAAAAAAVQLPSPLQATRGSPLLQLACSSEHSSVSDDDISEPAVLDIPLVDALNAGGHRRRRQAADALRAEGALLRKCYDREGCREVQLAFEVLDGPVLSELLTLLHGSAVLLSKSPFGNYVMQKVIEVMPSAQVGFIPQEFRGHVVSISKHRYACRILCRLLEHCGGEPGVAQAADELMAQANELCRHPFAHHVIESVVEHGLPQHRHQAFLALRADLKRNAADRHSSFVVEAALRCCSAADQQALAQALMGVEGTGDSLAALAQTRFGSHVVRSLLKLPGTSATTASRLRKDVTALWETRHGRRLLKDAGMAPEEALAAVAVAA